MQKTPQSDRSRIKKLFMITSISVSVAIMALKFYAYWITGSAAIFSDALESIINVLAALFGLYAVRLSEQPSDENHPYGHGKVEFIAAGFEGGLIIMAGGGILFQAGHSLLDKAHTIQELGTGLIFTLIALVANLLLGIAMLQAGKKQHSLTLQSGGLHLLSDSWSSVGLLLGLAIMYYTKLLWADGIVAAIMGVFVVLQGIKLVRKSLAGLMDESDTKTIQRIVDILTQHRKPAWIDIHNLRIVKYGADIHIDCHVTLPWYLTLQETHEAMSDIENTLRYNLGTRVEIFIHPDPCLDYSCSVCTLNTCAHRQHPLQEQLVWTPKNTMNNAKHGFLKPLANS